VAKESSEKLTYLMVRVLRTPHLWIVTVIVAILVVMHYHELFTGAPALERIGSLLGLGLSRHTLERILFLIPVAYGAMVFGLGGGLSVLALAAAAMLPRVFLISSEPREALFEIGGVIFTGLLIVLLFDSLQKGKQRLSELEAAHGMLNLQIKRLSMLHVISGMVSRSLELNQVLAVTEKLRQLMHTEASWLYLCDEAKRKLRLATSIGLPEAVLPESLKLGEDVDGVVAQSRKPVVIGNPSTVSLVESASLNRTGLQSALVVPLTAKGEILGTLGVGSPGKRNFPQDDVDLLHAIADQISMAIDNARLYERERSVAEALRVSERNYRELFERASDAIWVHDLDGRILAVNSAFERLTGYDRNSLLGSYVSILLSSYGLSKIDKQAHDVVLRGETAMPYEQELIKKDKSVATIQIGTSLITSDDGHRFFQHMARDVTEEKKIQDNLRFYAQQVGQAQEAERKRIARELHDETAQALVAVLRNLEDLASDHPQFTIKDMREQVRSILKGVRQFSQQLRPSILDDLGLLPAVRWLASELMKNYSIATDVKVVGEPHQISSDAELMLFRIIQEALNNVQKHSKANRACVTLEFIGHVTKATVSDDGKGFETPGRVDDLARSGKLGLTGMQERAELLGGNLIIDSKPGKGTILTVELPL